MARSRKRHRRRAAKPGSGQTASRARGAPAGGPAKRRPGTGDGPRLDEARIDGSRGGSFRGDGSRSDGFRSDETGVDETGGEGSRATRPPRRYLPMPDYFKRPPVTDYVNPLPFREFDDPDAPSTQEEIYEIRRVMATNIWMLPVICEEPACRRARQCAVREAPCIIRYQHLYADRAGKLYRALEAAYGA
jgi:hypothetical protein